MPKSIRICMDIDFSSGESNGKDYKKGILIHPKPYKPYTLNPTNPKPYYGRLRVIQDFVHQLVWLWLRVGECVSYSLNSLKGGL